MSDSTWATPLHWDRQAAAADTRPRVFCGSMCDWVDLEVPAPWRTRLWTLIRSTPNLTWLMPTKRASLIGRYLPSDWGKGYPHVWLDTTLENRKTLKHIDRLRGIPATMRFLSNEPLLEDFGQIDLAGIGRVIVGGENGPRRRPIEKSWVLAIIEQCRKAGIAFWFKQWVGDRIAGDCLLDGVRVQGLPGQNPENDNKHTDEQPG